MIIKRLTMNNFGVYEGENTFEFSYSLPVVLIGGMNGRGKTTFLEAILLALYGENSKAYKESKYKTYGQYLRSYVNKNSWTQRCFIELDFILNERDSEEYLIRREWNALSKRTSETLTVKQNGNINTFLTKNWQMFVENILPSALSSFYFFDGEKIAELAVDDTDAQMKESIRAMLGITVLDVLKNDLLRSVRRTEKNIQGEDVPAELNECKAEQEMLTAKLEETKKEVEELTELITDQIDQIELLHQEYAVKGGNALEQRQSLIQKRAELTAELEQNNSTLIELASGELPLLLVESLIRDIKLTAEDEHDDLIMQQAFGQLETLLCEYNRLHAEDVSANQEFVDFVKKHAFESQTFPVYKLSDHALFQANSLTEDLLSQKKEQTIDILERKRILKHQLDEVDSYLSLDINEKELTSKLSEIKKQESALVEMQVKKTTLDQIISDLESKLAIKTSEYNRMVERYLAAAELTDDAKRQLKYSNMALQIIDKFSVELQKRKTGALGETITECYKKLANKKNLINQIKVDPQSLALSYLDKQGNFVAKESLSAGEKQLMVIAILWALAICSAKKLPVIIDTPLSRLDSMHRKSLVTTYFPKASDQTIILSTDSEIDSYYYGLMKDYVGDEFTLEYDEETQSTTILKGYFQEK